MLNYRFGHNIFFAGLVGFLLGIIFSVTVWAGNRVIQDNLAIQEFESSLASITQPPFSLSLTTPVDGQVATDSTVMISGATSSPATVVVSGNSGDTYLDSLGQFNTPYQLVEGPNELNIFSVSDTGQDTSTVRNVFYNKEALP